MKVENLKDPDLTMSLRESKVQQKIRNEYHSYLDKLRDSNPSQRSATIMKVHDKKNALGATLHQGIESPFFGKKEIDKRVTKTFVFTQKRVI